MDVMSEVGDSNPHQEIYLYNLTNPDDIASGAEPIFESVGPFYYEVLKKLVDPVYDAKEKTVFASIRLLEVWSDTNTLDPSTMVIYNLDTAWTALYTMMYPLGVTESGMGMAMSCAYAGTISAYVGDALISTYYATAITDSGLSEQDFLDTVYTDVTANNAQGDTITNNAELLMAHWGSGAMHNLGNSVVADAGGFTEISSAMYQTIGATLLGTSYLDQTQITDLSNAFLSSPNWPGIGIYQVMRGIDVAMPSESECLPLTLAESQSVHTCMWDAVTSCGLGGIGLIAAGDAATGLAMFGLDSNVPNHVCYSMAIMAYPDSIGALGDQFFFERLKLEKGHENLMLIKKTATETLMGMNSAVLNAAGQSPNLPGVLLQHTTDEIAIAAGMNMKIHTGEDDNSIKFKLAEAAGGIGFDYDDDGNITPFGTCFSGSLFPPNQAQLQFTPFDKSFKSYEAGLFRPCDYKISGSTYKFGNYEAHYFERQDSTCFAANAEMGVNDDGYVSLANIVPINLFSTPPCMYGFEAEKKWADDCSATLDPIDHQTQFALDPISGAPMHMLSHSQMVYAFDDVPAAFDISTGSDSSYYYPSHRTHTRTELNDEDLKFIVDMYDLVFLLKDTLSYILIALGAVIQVITFFMMYRYSYIVRKKIMPTPAGNMAPTDKLTADTELKPVP